MVGYLDNVGSTPINTASQEVVLYPTVFHVQFILRGIGPDEIRYPQPKLEV